jgi:hypothetical protein
MVMSTAVFLLLGAFAAAPIVSEYTLLMRGLVVGSESWTGGGRELEFRTRFEFVRSVDLTGAVVLGDEGEVRSFRMTATGGNPMCLRFPWRVRRSGSASGRGRGGGLAVSSRAAPDATCWRD